MIHRYLLHNGQIIDSAAKVLMPGQLGLLAGWGVFSTLRVANGVLFAWDRHWARMMRDAKLMRVPMPADQAAVHAQLLSLVEANGISEVTLRIAIVRNTGGLWQSPDVDRPYDLMALTADIKDWGEAVRLGVVPQARHAENVFAGTKVLSWAQNLTWYDEAHDQGFDEVVLLNERDEVAECTSANIFAVFGNEIATPPLASGCLPGVTRALLLEEVKVDGFTTVERPLRLEDLERADQVFITSTTRGMLPVSFIDGLEIRNESEAAGKLNSAFERYVQDYVASHRAVPAG